EVVGQRVSLAALVVTAAAVGARVDHGQGLGHRGLLGPRAAAGFVHAAAFGGRVDQIEGPEGDGEFIGVSWGGKLWAGHQALGRRLSPDLRLGRTRRSRAGGQQGERSQGDGQT
ncbi:hypothetical protein RZS08_36070, partial [Arthrospira platensis SPKY1]|nr:hypothetical protein [Arthrospira platensis SPKY1]